MNCSLQSYCTQCTKSSLFYTGPSSCLFQHIQIQTSTVKLFTCHKISISMCYVQIVKLVVVSPATPHLENSKQTHWTCISVSRPGSHYSRYIPYDSRMADKLQKCRDITVTEMASHVYNDVNPHIHFQNFPAL